MAKVRGVAAEIAAAAGAAGLPDALLAADEPLLPLADPRALVLELAATPADRAGAVRRAGGRGRPAGSRNRRSEELAAYLLSRHAHPLVSLAETYSRPVAVLAAELGCTAYEAFQLQLRAMAELAPYLESKKPVAVQVDSRSIALTVHLGEPGGGGVVDDDGGLDLALQMVPTQGVENQGVSE